MSKKFHYKLEIVNAILLLLMVVFNCVMIVIYPDHDFNIIAAIICGIAVTMKYTDICIQSALENEENEDVIK